MKYLVIVFCLVTSSCLAADENKIQQRIETTLGKLIVENATLATNIETLTKQIEDLKKKLEEKDKK